MKIYKTKVFARWQKTERIPNSTLCMAVKEICSGLVDANLGGGIFKKRIARQGFGKSSSYRTIIATQVQEIWFFLFGFAKNEKDNISDREKQSLIETASKLLSLSEIERKQLLNEQKIFEVYYENK